MRDRFGEEIPPDAMPDDVWAAAHSRAQAIVACDLCDDDGYRGCCPCDHIDHTQAAKRGMEKIRAALRKSP